MKVWLDGHLLDKHHANISVYDHGLLYGDGVFEGIRFYNGRVFKLKTHLDRLVALGRHVAEGDGQLAAAEVRGVRRHDATSRARRQNAPARQKAAT